MNISYAKFTAIYKAITICIKKIMKKKIITDFMNVNNKLKEYTVKN